ncbi:MAG TPA: asparaginase [Lentisphaeria bacterium]|nr:MAG: asparaginase [Lentisphaerae bacterium GWF2_38_69]HBM16932.1 asparaginase [Lentisphaeria bacterium]
MGKIRIIAVGGTIDKVYFDDKSLYQVGTPTISNILAQAGATIKFEVDSILHKDSLEMTDEDRKVVAKKVLEQTEKRIVITHGTDTMVKTAKKVKKTLLDAKSDKTVVFTGSMTPAVFKSSDAEFNVGGAVAAVQCLPSGVYIVMSGRVFEADTVVKNVEKGRFEKIK